MAGNQIEEAAVVRIQDAPRAEARNEEPWFYLSRGGNGHDERRIRRLWPKASRKVTETLRKLGYQIRLEVIEAFLEISDLTRHELAKVGPSPMFLCNQIVRASEACNAQAKCGSHTARRRFTRDRLNYR